MKCVIRSRSGFEDIAPHVSRDFAPSETFPLILGEKNTLQLLFFRYVGRFVLILQLNPHSYITLGYCTPAGVKQTK